MNSTRISHILNRLMSEKHIRTAELARRINIAQPTLHRIVTGVCEHPHISSLKPIAEFFSITVDQLKGHELIPWLDNASKIPLLSWMAAIDWPNNKTLNQFELVLTDSKVGNNGYALKLQDASMDPVFPKNTTIITDPDKTPKDRSYVVAKLASYSVPIFRQLLLDANDRYLKPLSPDFDQYKMTRLDHNDKILSVVVQAKRDCEE